MEGMAGKRAESVVSLRSTTYRRVHQAILADILNGTFARRPAQDRRALCALRAERDANPRGAAAASGRGHRRHRAQPGCQRPVRRQQFISDIHEVRAALYPIIYHDAIAAADGALDKRLLLIQKRFDLLMSGRHEGLP